MNDLQEADMFDQSTETESQGGIGKELSHID